MSGLRFTPAAYGVKGAWGRRDVEFPGWISPTPWLRNAFKRNERFRSIITERNASFRSYTPLMDQDHAPSLPGRQREAARNDTLILQAAREVFIADADAPIAAVAVRAGVGIGALYRRYGSKEDLLRRLSRDGLTLYIELVEAALADSQEPGTAFATFMREAVIADTHSLTLHLAGRFVPTEDLWRDGDRAAEMTAALLARTQEAGALRPDITVGDLTMIFEQLAAVAVGDAERTVQLRLRYLALFLIALQPTVGAPLLPGPAPAWDEMSTRFAPNR